MLTVAYEAHGPTDGAPVVLLHGFPYDLRAYDGVAPALAAAGCRVVVPYLRGYGPTRFRSPATPRSGQQAALALDLLALLDALRIPRAGLARHRHALCKQLWSLWSPDWAFDDATYDRTAPSFDNPDFVDVVIHSYRVRYGLVAGDPACEAVERRLVDRPPISVPAISLDGGNDGVMRADGSLRHARFFTGPFSRRVIERVGHNLPQEAPAAFAAAVLQLADGRSQKGHPAP